MRFFVFASSLALLSACGGVESSGVVSAESIGLTASGSSTIAVGQSVTLYVHASDANGTRIPAFSAVTWSSSNPTVATVTKTDSTGTVTGLAAGESVISAMVKQGVVANVTVRVGSVPIIGVSPSAAVFTAYRNSSVSPLSVSITNAGSGSLTSLSATTTAPWLAVSFVDGNTSANPTATLRLQPSMGSLADGTYATTVTITSTVSGVAPRSLPVTLQVAPGPVAFKMEATTSASQGGSAGQPVAQPPAVIVRAADDTPVSGVAVTFAVNGGGSVSPSGIVTTNANGIAALSSWTLGSAPGASQTVTASSPGLANSPITFTATALSASKIAKLSGDNQTTVLGRPLPQPVVVRVLDPNDTPVPNATVTFVVASGGGTVSASSATTAANGQAIVSWTLGAPLGVQSLTASLVGPPGSPTVTFSATATGATAIAKVSGDAQSASAGSPLASPLRVRVTGANAEPVINETVTFAPSADGGTVNPTTVKTDANGEASAQWVLSTTTGAKTLVASISPATGGVSVTFNATATPPPPSGITIVSGDGQSGRVGGALPQQIVVRVVTTIGTGIPGATVTFTPASGSGQSFTPASGTTDSNGEVRATWTIGSAFGGYTATVASSGLPSRTITATGSLPPVGSGMFTGGAAKVPSGSFSAGDQPVMRYAGPVSGEVPLNGGGFSTPQVPAGTYTITIASNSGGFPPTSVYGATAVSGQITSLGTIPVAYSGTGNMDLSAHACPNIGDANGTATVQLYTGVNGDQGGALAYSWTIPFGTEELKTGVSYGIYTMKVTATHNTDASKKCAVYRSIVQHSSPLTNGHTNVPIINMTNP